MQKMRITLLAKLAAEIGNGKLNASISCHVSFCRTEQDLKWFVWFARGTAFVVQCSATRTGVMKDKKDTITFKFDGANISTDALGSSSLPLADYAPEDMGEWIKKNGSAIGIEAFKGVNLADFIAEQRI